MGQLPQTYALDALPDDAAVGARAQRLARAVRLNLPVPPALVLDKTSVDMVAAGAPAPVLKGFLGPFLSLRSSPENPAWGGPQAFLNLGITDATLPLLVDQIGELAALRAYRRLIQAYGTRVHGLEAEDFEALYYSRKDTGPLTVNSARKLVDASLAFYQANLDAPFPQDPAVQFQAAMRLMAQTWHAPTTKILRQANGAPDDAGMGLIVQRMVFGLGDGGAGRLQLVDSLAGHPTQTGLFMPDAQGSDLHRRGSAPRLFSKAEREAAGQSQPALTETHADAASALVQIAGQVKDEIGDQQSIYFTIEGAGAQIWLMDMVPVRRSAAAAVRIAVDLARSGVIGRDAALMRIEPRQLSETLHPQIEDDARRDVFGQGVAASPGAAVGPICFSSQAAQAAYAQGEPAILVRNETTPDDIRGMHAAAAVLTISGGMTSHAAVIARGLGVPCVVGVSDLRIDSKAGHLIAGDGRKFSVGDVISLDGTAGEALAGAAKTRPASTSDAFETLMAWADGVRRLRVRANADTPADAQVARRFRADGIGLCRTEHTFFEGDRITAMRQMILADTTEDRQRALDQLLPMQRADFEELFELMPGQPVTIRLLDPPLHEFLPRPGEETDALVQATGMSVEAIRARAEALAEFNPMLGKRGVRVGVTMPEIYDMQARAIFEAAHAAGERAGAEVIPEIMIPLVSANREVELIRKRIEALAAAVARERGVRLTYKVGVMVETPRAALRAGDLAETSHFLSFGTNDLTQMTYGLSRDDAGRFMRDYVAKGVFPEDPFHTLDLEGVGELILIASKRGRDQNADLVLGLCGEHGGDPASIRFCELAGFDYVSCSPYRVPAARLASAQAAILANQDEP